MSVEENFSKLKTDDAEQEGVKRQDIELTKFIKYVKLVPILRHHVLTYCTGSTRHNYSQCSNFSNSEIQVFNTNPPANFVIKEYSNGFRAVLRYGKGNIREQKSIVKHFEFSEFENTTEEIQKWLLKYFKYVKQKTACAEVNVNVVNWPMNLMKSEHLANAAVIRVTIYNSMYNDFMEYLKDARHQDLCLYDCAAVAYRVTIPADFFKSTLFQNLNTAIFNVRCEIEGEDFINMENKLVSLRTSINFDDIREKVRRWSRTSHENKFKIRINLPDDDDRTFDLGTMFPTEQFAGVLLNDNAQEQFQMGNILVVKVYDEPKSIDLYFKKD